MGAERVSNVRAWQRNFAALAHLGRIEETKSALAHLLKLQPGFSVEYVAATNPFREPAHAAIFADGLRKAGWRG